MEAKANILIVDDESGIRLGCRRALEPQGFSVDTAETLEEGRQKIEAGMYDLVLLDVMMPDGRGMDLLAPIRERDPETVVIVITGYATVELAVEAIRRGAYDFIAKPFTADVLLMAVNQAAEKRHLSRETKRLQTVEQEAAAMALAKAEAERLSQFKSHFTYLVAHELRAPISGAQSLLRTMTRGLAGELTEKQRSTLQRVEKRLDQLLALVNDLLALAASKAIAPDEPLAPVSLAAILHRVVDRYTIDADQKQIAITCDRPPDTLLVYATEDGLERVLSNLIDNAVKYTECDGQVSVTLATLPEAVTITIADTGIGIPADDLSHIWDEFYRAQNARQSKGIGTGLGLSIVKQLVETFNGSIAVNSVEGKGTTFTLCLGTPQLNTS